MIASSSQELRHRRRMHRHRCQVCRHLGCEICFDPEDANAAEDQRADLLSLRRDETSSSA